MGMGPPPADLQSAINTWTILSIVSIVTCGCLMIPGIVSLVTLSNAKSAMAMGDYMTAQSKLQTAKTWAIVGLVFGGLSIVGNVLRFGMLGSRY